MEIKRDLYLEQLKIRKDNGMIKIITGIRRCGKSFLLFVLFKKWKSGLRSIGKHRHLLLCISASYHLHCIKLQRLWKQ